MSLPPATLGYVAAILDMKALILYKRNSDRSISTKQITVSVQFKEREMAAASASVRMLLALTGTKPEFKESIETKHWMRRGCAEHCPDQHIHYGNGPYGDPVIGPTLKWTVTGSSAAVVIYNVYPYLHSDKGWGELLVEIMKQTVLHGQGWGMVRVGLVRLRELGWELPPSFEAAVNRAVDTAGTDIVLSG